MQISNRLGVVRSSQIADNELHTSDIQVIFSPSQILKRLAFPHNYGKYLYRVKTKRGKRTYRYITVCTDLTHHCY